METKIRLNFKDNHTISESFLKAVINSVIANPNNNYTKEINYVDRFSGSMVLKICDGEEHLTVSRLGETDDGVEVHGPMSFIKNFLAELAIEASTLITQELCGSIFDEEGVDIFEGFVADKIREGITTSLKECRKLVVDNS